MAKSNLRLVSPATEKPTVATPRRPTNAEVRTREHLTPAEVEAVAKTAKGNRYGLRDATMIRMAYRHGLRVSELVDLRWTQVNLNEARLHVRRLKGSKESTHPIQGDELRALRELRRENPHGEFIFVSERGGPFSADGFQRMIERAAEKAGLETLKIHPHMLRHACGHKLANEGKDSRAIQDYLGHANAQSTVRYTQLSPERFKDFRW
jgi:type 1 fimbriae regulatory protein FimB/type 1 fimbriae regulatory protein FimE